MCVAKPAPAQAALLTSTPTYMSPLRNRLISSRDSRVGTTSGVSEKLFLQLRVSDCPREALSPSLHVAIGTVEESGLVEAIWDLRARLL